ncbi:MAG: hypothetical protein B7C24_08945 [Bacteroidetes bacterium 4572_77]|nr:MAG: hypothetical protein B7C24_08945 [Bacteroidetes bacterium 4572_77]
MKKLLLIAFSLVMVTFAANAQHIFNKGDVAINAGIGAFGYGGFVPSIEISGEIGVIPTGEIGIVSFGGEIGYKYSSYSWAYSGYSNDYHYHQFIFGGRAAWHLQTFESDKWDAYAGVAIGMRTYTNYDTWNWEDNEYESSAHIGSYSSVFVGGRMMMSESFGLFAEVGYSHLSSVRFGMTFKL